MPLPSHLSRRRSSIEPEEPDRNNPNSTTNLPVSHVFVADVLKECAERSAADEKQVWEKIDLFRYSRRRTSDIAPAQAATIEYLHRKDTDLGLDSVPRSAVVLGNNQLTCETGNEAGCSSHSQSSSVASGLRICSGAQSLLSTSSGFHSSQPSRPQSVRSRAMSERSVELGIFSDHETRYTKAEEVNSDEKFANFEKDFKKSNDPTKVPVHVTTGKMLEAFSKMRMSEGMKTTVDDSNLDPPSILIWNKEDVDGSHKESIAVSEGSLINYFMENKGMKPSTTIVKPKRVKSSASVSTSKPVAPKKLEKSASLDVECPSTKAIKQKKKSLAKSNSDASDVRSREKSIPSSDKVPEEVPIPEQSAVVHTPRRTVAPIKVNLKMQKIISDESDSGETSPSIASESVMPEGTSTMKDVQPTGETRTGTASSVQKEVGQEEKDAALMAKLQKAVNSVPSPIPEDSSIEKEKACSSRNKDSKEVGQEEKDAALMAKLQKAVNSVPSPIPKDSGTEKDKACSSRTDSKEVSQEKKDAEFLAKLHNAVNFVSSPIPKESSTEKDKACSSRKKDTKKVVEKEKSSGKAAAPPTEQPRYVIPKKSKTQPQPSEPTCDKSEKSRESPVVKKKSITDATSLPSFNSLFGSPIPNEKQRPSSSTSKTSSTLPEKIAKKRSSDPSEKEKENKKTKIAGGGLVPPKLPSAGGSWKLKPPKLDQNQENELSSARKSTAAPSSATQATSNTPFDEILGIFKQADLAAKKKREEMMDLPENPLLTRIASLNNSMPTSADTAQPSVDTGDVLSSKQAVTSDDSVPANLNEREKGKTISPADSMNVVVEDPLPSTPKQKKSAEPYTPLSPSPRKTASQLKELWAEKLASRLNQPKTVVKERGNGREESQRTPPDDPFQMLNGDNTKSVEKTKAGEKDSSGPVDDPYTSTVIETNNSKKGSKVAVDPFHAMSAAAAKQTEVHTSSKKGPLSEVTCDGSVMTAAAPKQSESPTTSTEPIAEATVPKRREDPFAPIAKLTAKIEQEKKDNVRPAKTPDDSLSTTAVTMGKEGSDPARAEDPFSVLHIKNSPPQWECAPEVKVVDTVFKGRSMSKAGSSKEDAITLDSDSDNEIDAVFAHLPARGIAKNLLAYKDNFDKLMKKVEDPFKPADRPTLPGRIAKELCSDFAEELTSFEPTPFNVERCEGSTQIAGYADRSLPTFMNPKDNLRVKREELGLKIEFKIPLEPVPGYNFFEFEEPPEEFDEFELEDGIGIEEVDREDGETDRLEAEDEWTEELVAKRARLDDELMEEELIVEEGGTEESAYQQFTDDIRKNLLKSKPKPKPAFSFDAEFKRLHSSMMPMTRISRAYENKGITARSQLADNGRDKLTDEEIRQAASRLIPDLEEVQKQAKKAVWPFPPYSGAYWPIFQPFDGVDMQQWSQVATANIQNQMTDLSCCTARDRVDLLCSGDVSGWTRDFEAACKMSNHQLEESGRFKNRIGYARKFNTESLEESRRKDRIREEEEEREFRRLQENLDLVDMDVESDTETEKDPNHIDSPPASPGPEEEVMNDPKMAQVWARIRYNMVDEFSRTSDNPIKGKRADSLYPTAWWSVPLREYVPSNDRRLLQCQMVNRLNSATLGMVNSRNIRDPLDAIYRWQRPVIQSLFLHMFDLLSSNEGCVTSLRKEDKRAADRRMAKLESTVAKYRGESVPIPLDELLELAKLEDWEKKYWPLIWDGLCSIYRNYPPLSHMMDDLQTSVHRAFQKIAPTKKRSLYSERHKICIQQVLIHQQQQRQLQLYQQNGRPFQ